MKPIVGLRAYGLATAAYGAGGLLLTWPLPLHLSEAIPGDGFDGWQNLWNLWWVRRALLEPGNELWHTSMLDHPRGVSLLFHTLNLPNGLLSLPVQEIWGLIPAYNFLVLLSFALGGLGAYLLALRVLGQRSSRARVAAVLAGAVYAYGPFHFAHLLGHMQVFSLQWLPLYALALHRMLTGLTHGRRVRPPALLALVFLVLASLTDWYNLVYLSILTMLWALWFARGASDAGRRLALVLAPALVLVAAAALLSPLLVPMALEAREADYMLTGESHIVSLSADLLGLALPQEMHPLWGETIRTVADRFTSSTSERMLSLGLAPMALAALAWWQGRRRSRPFVWAALVFAVLALGPVLHVGGEVVHIGGRPVILPGLALYRWVPFFAIARSVGRYAVMAGLSVAVLAALGLETLSSRLGRGWWLAPLTAAALVILEFLPAPYPLSAPDTPAWYDALAGRGQGALLNLPVNWDRPQYLLYQTTHGRPLTSGYTSRRNPWSPVESYPGLQQLRRLGDDVLAFPDSETFATIAQDLELRYLVLDDYQMPGADERDATRSLTERLMGGQDGAHYDGRLTVYEVEKPATERAYARLDGVWGPVKTGPDGEPVRERCADCEVWGRTGVAAADFTVTCLSGTSFVVHADAGVDVALLAVHPECTVLTSVTWSER